MPTMPAGPADVDRGGVADHPAGSVGVEVDGRPVAVMSRVLGQAEPVDVGGVHGGKVIVDGVQPKPPDESGTARVWINDKEVAAAGEVVAPAQVRRGEAGEAHWLEQSESDVEGIVAARNEEIAAAVQVTDQRLHRGAGDALEKQASLVMPSTLQRSRRSRARRGEAGVARRPERWSSAA